MFVAYYNFEPGSKETYRTALGLVLGRWVWEIKVFNREQE